MAKLSGIWFVGLMLFYRSRLFWFLVLALIIPVRAQAQENDAALSGLRKKLEAHLDQARFAQAQWGVKIVSLDTGKTVFEHNADKLLKPASNAKIYTAALALDRLGPDYRIKTSFYAAAKPDADGVIKGDLLVYGRGDPSFAARFNDGDYAKSLQPVIAALKAAGVKRIAGGLIGDDSFFHGPPYGTDWTWDDLQNSYGAPCSALSLEDNVIDLIFKPGADVGNPARIVTMPDSTYVTFSNRTQTTAAGNSGHIRLYRALGENTAYAWGHVPAHSSGVTDAISVANPALWFVTQLKKEMAQQGIEVGGGVRSLDWLARETAPFNPAQWVEIAFVNSRTVAEIVQKTLKPSQNLYAQLLLLQVGSRVNSDEDGRSSSTEELGLSEMRKFLGEAGIARGRVLLEEGSGLSRGALVTPSASVQLLTYMARHRQKTPFFDALPIGGIDGTLRHRFNAAPALGNVHAKTGSLGHVDSLSGYLTTKANERLVFSMMLNNYSSFGGHSDGRAEIDVMVEILAALPQRIF